MLTDVMGFIKNFVMSYHVRCMNLLSVLFNCTPKEYSSTNQHYCDLIRVIYLTPAYFNFFPYVGISCFLNVEVCQKQLVGWEQTHVSVIT